MDNDHLSTGLVGFHDAMGFTDLVEAKDPGRLDVEPTSRSVRRDSLKRHIGQREAWGAKDEAGEES